MQPEESDLEYATGFTKLDEPDLMRMRPHISLLYPRMFGNKPQDGNKRLNGISGACQSHVDPDHAN